MKEQSMAHPPRNSSQRGFASYVVIALLTVIIIVLLSVFFFAPDTVTKFSQTAFQSADRGQNDQPDGDEPAVRNGPSGDSAGQVELSDTKLSGSPLPDTEDSDIPGIEENKDNETGEAATPASGRTDEAYESLAVNIDSFFESLDSRDYIREFQLDAPSNEYFPALIQTLVNNPPVVSGETDDLFTILQNTAHFFRILGKKNILLLKGILDRERDTFERTLADFYLLTDSPDTLKNHFNLTIGQDELYAYAGFFLNTMGGRLYLFRRDSMSRMVVNFYAIQVIDRANRAGRNKYGIEIKDAIDNLILEIESSRIKLKMRETYLDTLYDLKIRYQ